MTMNTIEPTGSLRVLLCFSFNKRATREVDELKKYLVRQPCVSHAVELNGTFDFIAEATLDNFQCYNELLKEIADAITRATDRFETNFICRRYVRSSMSGDRRCFWVPCIDGHIRVDFNKIDKICAEGDYMRIHSGQESWLMHSTMRMMHRELGAEDFVLLHRSVLVRLDFIDRLIHRENGWFARLGDGTDQKIARSQVTNVLAMVRNSGTTRQTPPTPVDEKILISLDH